MTDIISRLDLLPNHITKSGNKVTVEFTPIDKKRRGPHLVVEDSLVLAWLSNKGYNYNVTKVLKSGHVDNLDVKNSDGVWIFEVEQKKVPKKKAAPKPPAAPRNTATAATTATATVKPKPTKITRNKKAKTD